MGQGLCNLVRCTRHRDALTGDTFVWSFLMILALPIFRFQVSGLTSLTYNNTVSFRERKLRETVLLVRKGKGYGDKGVIGAEY